VESAIQVESLTPVGSFPNQFHVLFGPDQRSDALAKQGVIVYR
jgi:hypothetical protein